MTHLSATPPTDSVSVRRYLCDALRIDLVGPLPEDAALQRERLPQAPSRWYLTGFLAPGDAPEEQLAQDDEEAPDEPAEPLHGGDDAGTPDRGSHKRLFLPSSMGLSLLVDEETKRLDIAVSWGDYAPEIADTPGVADAPDAAGGPGRPTRFELPGSGGLAVVCLVRPTRVQALGGSRAARAVSLFTVNRRPPAPDGDGQDAAFAFQVEMHVEADRPLIPRVNLNGLDSADWDERLADLHYRDVAEYAVGHNVSTRADLDGGDCRRVRTEWMLQAGVPRVEPSAIGTVEFGMEALGGLDGAPAAKTCLEPLVEQYRDWIAAQRQDAAAFTGRRREVAEELVRRAGRVAVASRPASICWPKRTCSKPSASPTGRWLPPRAAGGRWRKGSDRGTSRRRRGVRSSLPTS